MSKEVKAIFLDRDGVIVYDPGHLDRKEQVRLLPGAKELSKLQDEGFILIIVSNQAAVARNLLNERQMWEIDKFIREKLQEVGVEIRASYYCPHHPDFTGPCGCRKPEPGLFFQAIKELNIDPGGSFVVGDKPSDLEAGRRAGVKMGILVKRNGQSWDATKAQRAKIEYKAESLAKAIKIIKEVFLGEGGFAG